MITTIFFDLDDTLFDFKKSESEAIKKTFISLEIEPSDDNANLYSSINKSCWEALERGEITRNELLTKRFDMLFSALSVERDSAEAKSIYEKNLAHSVFFIEGAEELIKDLSLKYSLYITTNGSATVQNSRLDISGIRKHFKGIFISEEIGFNKPSAHFFAYVLDKIPFAEKSEMLIVGDSPSSDILSGKNIGIKTCLFNPKKATAQPKADYEIYSLRELKNLLLIL